jgi:hypothetical protein
MLVGDIWTGEISNACENIQGDSAFQLVYADDSDQYYFVSSFNAIMPDYSYCLLQLFFGAFIDTSSNYEQFITFYPAEDSEGIISFHCKTSTFSTCDSGNVGYYRCQNPDYSFSAPESFDGTISADLSQIEIPFDDCSNLVLKR